MKVPFADFNSELKGSEEDYSNLLLKHISNGEFIVTVNEFEENFQTTYLKT